MSPKMGNIRLYDVLDYIANESDLDILLLLTEQPAQRLQCVHPPFAVTRDEDKVDWRRVPGMRWRKARHLRRLNGNQRAQT
jgi:hypothetical protein